MAKLKFKNQYNNFIPVVQDVKVNNQSVFNGRRANIKLKTINGESIVGRGNIQVGGTSHDNAATIIRIPTLPRDAAHKTYVLKAINGTLTWIEE